MKRILTAAVLASFIGGGARGNEADVETGTGWYVLAIGLARACPGWEIRADRAVSMLSAFGISLDDFDEGHRYHQLFMTTASTVKTNIGKQTTATSCADAEGMFGPKGALVKSMMYRR